jgi:hypothetical protein
MPITPLHFGPHATVALPLHRYIDVPVFIAANVIVDIEPMLVMVFDLNYPLHGYCHTLLIGGLLGALLGCAAYPFRARIGQWMSEARLPYSTTLAKMALSGMLGAWLHVLFDAVIYCEMRPFYPLSPANPFLGIISRDTTLYGICALFFVPAVAAYFYVRRKGNMTDGSKKM